VADGNAASVSAFVQHAVRVSLNDVAGWASLLADALVQTGGPLTAGERAWADSVLGKPARRRPGGVSGITFDAGGLLALDRSDRRVIVLVARAAETGAPITVPATALAQAIRDPARRARLARMLRQPATDVVALDALDATQVGRLLPPPEAQTAPTLTSCSVRGGPTRPS
jgi:hypothetical protein